MEQIKRIQGDSVHLISVNGDKPLKLSQISVGGGGGSTRPHYTGQTEFTPSTVTQTAQTEGLIVDSDITVNAMPIGSAKTPTVNVEANPTITMDGNGLVTASYSKTESITPNVTAGYVASGTSGNVTFRGSATYQVPSASVNDEIIPDNSGHEISVSSDGLVTATYWDYEWFSVIASAGWIGTDASVRTNIYDSFDYQLPTKSASDLSVSGSVVTAASGFYPSAVSANVASGYLGATTVIAGQTASTHTYKVERQAATSGWYEASAVRNAGTVTLNNQSISATPTESAQTFTPTNSVSYITQVTVNPIPSEYIVPSGTLSITSNASGVDVSTYAFADVAVPWTWMGEEPTVVNSSFYSDSYLLGSTSYNGWTGSTTAKAIVASAAAGTFVASAMNEYEYLINWQMDVSCVLKSTATKKATPIREVGNVWQLITRRPNSVTNITNDNFNGNTAYTYFTAPFLQYWNTSGSSTYTWSNSYGIYGTVQTPTFSNNTSDSPTLTLKTPIWYARCSSTYFATGRVGDIDQTETTLKRTCKIYRVKKGTPPREMYEGLVNIINNPL